MKKAIWVGMIAGSILGGWIPVQFGADGFSIASIVGSTIGGMMGVYAGWWLVRRLAG